MDNAKTKTTKKTTKPAGRPANRAEKNQGMNWIRQEKRAAIYLRDNCRCTYCLRGAESGVKLTLDHVVPYYLGGANSADNLVTACFDCNSLRRDLPVEEFADLLSDRGVDPSGVFGRIKASLSAPIDVAAGRAYVAARKAAR